MAIKQMRLDPIMRIIPAVRDGLRTTLRAIGMVSEAETLTSLHKALISFNKRAERSSADMLVATFVDSAPLLDLLSTTNNQVIYGRRGTGKTHALKFLSERVTQQGDMAVYIDLRSIGSNGSIYGDPTRSMAERASVLVVDVLTAIQDELYQAAIAKIDTAPNPQEITARLDDFAASISSVQISGTVEAEDHKTKSTNNQTHVDASLAAKSDGLTMKLGAGVSTNQSNSVDQITKRSGKESIHLNFGSVMTSLTGLLGVLGSGRTWLLIDEWSEIPVDLQPYLADLIRRTILPVPAITTKIAAIEHRSDFALLKTRGEYIGIELGADMAADLNSRLREQSRKGYQFFQKSDFQTLCQHR